MKGFVDLCWFTIKWGLLLAAVTALVAAPYFYHRLDDEIRRHVEERLASQYPDLRVAVRAAQLVAGEGIVIRGVSLSDPKVDGPLAELATVEEIFIACNTDLTDIATGNLIPRRIVVRRPTVRFWRRPDGDWNASRLIPQQRLLDTPPPVTIDHGVYELYDLARPDLPALKLREAQLTIQVTIEQPLIVGGRSPLRVQGTCTTDFLRQAKIDALVDLDGRAWRAGGAVEAFEINAQDWQSLPGVGLPVPELLRGFRARWRGQWSVDYVTGREPALQFNVAGRIEEGRIDDPRLVYPVTELSAEIACNHQGLRITQCSGRHGQAILRGELERYGFAENSPLRLVGQFRGLHLDQKLVQILPDRWQTEWHKYMPVGEVDADARIEFDGSAWRPAVNLHCTNLSFTHYKFPYRLERGRGNIELAGPQFTCNMVAYSGNAEVRITSQVSGPSSPPRGWVELRGENARFDEKLLFALPEKSAEVLRTMHPTGTANFFYRWWNDPAEGPEPHQFAQVALNRCSMRLDKFPYSIDELTGIAELRDKSWTFRDVRGSNDRGRVAINGQLTPAAVGYDLELHAVATNIAFEDELHDAISPGAQRLWQALRPHGMLNLTLDLRHNSQQRGMRLWVRAEPVEESVSIEPVQFPYRLDNVRGVFVFSDGRVSIDGFKAGHGRATLTAHGNGDLAPDGSWTLHLEHFHWDRLVADRDFVAALPGRLKKLVSGLDVKGPVSLHGAVDLTGGGPEGEPFHSQWDVHADFHQAVLNCGIRLDDVNGGLNLAGNFDGRQFRCRGDVALDSLVFREHQFTDVRGPIWVDDTRLLVGYWADRVRDAKPERRLTARLYGGTVVGDGWVDLGGEPRYQVSATLARGDLAAWTRQMAPGQSLTGEVMADVELRGRGGNMNDLAGSGSIQLRNADIYELPLMVSLLKLLSVQRPDATAFTTSDIDFRIQGEHLYVDRMELNGDAISLLGKGEVGMNRQINLAFYAVVGRDETRTPLLRTLLGGASQQIMQIHAEGTLDQPVTRREAFPGVNQALQQLQAEFQGREEARKKAQAERSSIFPRFR